MISIKSEPIDNDDLTSTALSFYAQYYESLVLNGNSPNLIDKILEKKTDYENNSLRETHLDMEMNLLAIANNTYTNSTIESDAQVNDITSVLKNKDDSEGVMDAENNMLDGAKYSLVNLKNTEENLLEPLYFKDWVDESYNHVPKVNTKKSKNTEVEFNQIENDKRQMQACARPKFKEKGKASEQRTKSVTQSKHDSDNDYVRPGLLRKIMKRASQDMSKEIHALELMNDQQWSSHSTVESETKYIPIPKRIKINGDDSNLSLQSKVKSEAKSNLTQARMQYGLNIIKEANAQDKMNDDTFLHCVIVKSERNYHSNQANRENDNKDEMNLNELKLSDDPSLNHLNKKKLKEPTETKAEVNAKSNVLKKTLNSFLKKDGQQIRKQIPIETGEVNLSKLLLVPVVTLEKNEILDRKMETKSDRINETKKKDKKKTIDPETNEKKLTPNDFIENNKEITLEELGGEFSDDETYNSEATQIDKPSSNIEINEEKSNVKNKTKILKSLYTEEVIDSNELELLRETLKEGNFFKTALYKCYLCVQVFSGTRDLRNHKRLHKKVSQIQLK